MSIKAIIEQKLTENLNPTSLVVEDESYKHEGHAGARPEGETHFKVIIASEAFKGLSRVQIHQKIYKVLEAEMNNPIHALAIEASVV